MKDSLAYRISILCGSAVVATGCAITAAYYLARNRKKVKSYREYTPKKLEKEHQGFDITRDRYMDQLMK